MNFLISLAHGLLQLSAWIVNNKELLGVVIGGSGLVSLTLEPLKKWLALQSHTVITLLHYLFALIAVAVHYIATSSSSRPTVLFLQALVVLGANQFIYPVVTKPLSDLISDAKVKATVADVDTVARQVSADFNG